MGMDNTLKRLPVGMESFNMLRADDFYYVDKTGLIRDLIYSWAQVTLFTRPRRFGKSLNMSMLRSFFEIGADPALFEGLEILEEEQICEEHMGRYPVISISLKGVGADTFSTSRGLIALVIKEEAERHRFLAESDRLTESERESYFQLLNEDIRDEVLFRSLRTLSRLLNKHYGKKTIILIDEYDVPLAKANEKGYYTQMVELIRSLLNEALKTNDSLYFAVMTGCLRVARESIFTGLNNLRVIGITTVGFEEYFGFTDYEVRQMLAYYGFADCYELTKEWYDGYRFGNQNVYCPWDVINYIADLRLNPLAQPKNYWSHTSSNYAVRKFIEQVDFGQTKAEIESLIAGETVMKEIHEDLTYDCLYDTIDNIWSVLFMTGYLTWQGEEQAGQYSLKIPNREIRNIFSIQIMEMFREDLARDGEHVNAFCNAIRSGDASEVERQFGAFLRRTISVRDSNVKVNRKENFYHGILIGILGFKSGWKVKSNEESGDGYSDILIEMESDTIEEDDIGIIIEVKYAEKAQYDRACKEAFEQIDRMNYVEKLEDDGFHTIYKYGIACFKKKCKVVCEKISGRQ